MSTLDMSTLPHTVELAKSRAGVVFKYVDQRLLPDELKIAETRDWREVVTAIKTLAVRGAPAIGLAGASAFVLWMASEGRQGSASDAAEAIASARPTAVNLRWAVERVASLANERGADNLPVDADACIDRLYNLVKQMEAEDEAACRAIGENGAQLVGEGARILTHCNAGSLATCYYGTALGVVYAAAERGKVQRVFADETRPVGQGARLTAWELSRVGIPVTLICDNMAASLIATGGVDLVVVGADRITRNGDVANKIGTYGVAVLAREHGIPFYVAAPVSTFDGAMADGSCIPIEQRNAVEVLPHPIPGVDVWNPSFDVTPARYVTAVITERGVFKPEELAEKLNRK